MKERNLYETLIWDYEMQDDAWYAESKKLCKIFFIEGPIEATFVNIATCQ